MKPRKFFGITSRSVLEQVRAELGPDAVILGNRSTTEGIEITALAGAAMDDLLGQQHTASERPSSRTTAAADIVARPFATDAVAPLVTAAAVHANPAEPVDSSSPAMPARDPLSARLMDEVAALRELLEHQLAQFAWNDALRRTPLRAQFMRELLHAGFGPDFARDVVHRLPDDFSATEALQWLTTEIAAGVHCAGPEADIVAQGGIYALTGATGVGKTTTAAKLAARCAVRHGANSLALLTTDSYRVGAHDQLRIYARILGVSVHTVNGTDDMRQALDSLLGKHLVLIDTLGMGQRDARVREHATLLDLPEIKRLLVLGATAQAETLEEVVRVYRPAPDGSDDGFAGCIVTKLDEAVRLGDVLDVVIRHSLPLHYLSTGQRVPEDLHVPNVRYLVHRALRSGAKSRTRTLDDDEVGLVLGSAPGAAHA